MPNALYLFKGNSKLKLLVSEDTDPLHFGAMGLVMTRVIGLRSEKATVQLIERVRAAGMETDAPRTQRIIDFLKRYQGDTVYLRFVSSDPTYVEYTETALPPS